MTISKQLITTSDELIARAVAIAEAGRKPTVAVAAAQDADVIGAVAEARSDGFLEAVLFGDRDRIKVLAAETDTDISDIKVVHEPDTTRAAHGAARMASEGKAGAIMKGFLPTSALLRTVLDKQYGLRGKNTLSHCAVLDIPGHHKLLNFTDGGMVVSPTTDQKMQILENAVLVARALGISPVKIAVSGPSLRAVDGVPHTINDSETLAVQAAAELQDIVIAAPMPLEIALSKAAAGHGPAAEEVAGDADIFLVDSIEEGNIVAKSLIQFARAVFAGVIVGARVPVSLVSRTDTVK
ncbi:MAG: phosphate butyryltransferase, partial [candidate division Zixibacteria bacterium]|nr:phosphate butyryltransferase [candidate division Zixibacteria bacterium]